MTVTANLTLDTERATMNGIMQPFFIAFIYIEERLFTAIHCGGV